MARGVPGPELPVGRAGRAAPKSIRHTHKWYRKQVVVRECVLAAAEVGERGEVGRAGARRGYPEKRRGREGWKQASLTAARWPRSTATGSGGGRRRGRSRPAISSRVVVPVQSDGGSSGGGRAKIKVLLRDDDQRKFITQFA